MITEATLEQAIDALNQGDLPLAESVCRGSLANDPNQPDLAHVLGFILHRSGRTPEGIESVQRAIALSPTNTAYLNTSGYFSLELGDLEGALLYFRRALTIDNQLPEVHHNVGSLMVDMGDPEGAIPHYREAIALRPEWIDPYFALGSILIEHGQHDEAKICFQNIMQIDPHHTPAQISLGNIFSLTGEWLNAERVYQSLLQENPDSHIALLGLAFSSLQQGKRETAIGAYERAIELEPILSPDVYYNLGLLYREEGETEEAIDRLKTVVEMTADQSADAHYHLGTLLIETGEWEGAITSLQRAIALDPTNLQFREAIAGFFGDVGMDAHTAAHYQAIAELSPSFENRVRSALYLPPIYKNSEDIQIWRDRLTAGIEWLESQELVIPDTIDLWKLRNLGAYMGQVPRRGVNSRLSICITPLIKRPIAFPSPPLASSLRSVPAILDSCTVFRFAIHHSAQSRS